MPVVSTQLEPILAVTMVRYEIKKKVHRLIILMLGAAVFLDQFLNRNLAHFPCRHHIFELILKLVFETKVVVSSGPTVAIFDRFKKHWGIITLPFLFIRVN